MTCEHCFHGICLLVEVKKFRQVVRPSLAEVHTRANESNLEFQAVGECKAKNGEEQRTCDSFKDIKRS